MNLIDELKSLAKKLGATEPPKEPKPQPEPEAEPETKKTSPFYLQLVVQKKSQAKQLLSSYSSLQLAAITKKGEGSSRRYYLFIPFKSAGNAENKRQLVAKFIHTFKPGPELAVVRAQEILGQHKQSVNINNYIQKGILNPTYQKFNNREY